MYRRGGFLSLFLVGGYYLWRNRFQVQRMLESRGIDLPVMGNNLSDRFRSLTAKFSGSTEHGIRSLDNETRRAAV